ncbi:hypothetical protein BDA96_04G385500 [Sorghum bicolor]|uniref:Uncharacterized protein n=1 Tax=Sorghum bicolor TaxID=4558 RepID=A0A921R9A5_SORBI|nr:hypothetical protein BDA96_04G385500 [Sorghum bicolor]
MTPRPTFVVSTPPLSLSLSLSPLPPFAPPARPAEGGRIHGVVSCTPTMPSCSSPWYQKGTHRRHRH